jgi:hypothetical protein
MTSYPKILIANAPLREYNNKGKPNNGYDFYVVGIPIKNLRLSLK